MKRVLLLGSTGSIGRQTIDVIESHPELFCVDGLAAYSNIELLASQAAKTKAKRIAIVNEEAYNKYISAYNHDGIEVYCGFKGLIDMCEASDANIALGAIVGIAGLPCIIACINKGMDIALANKETLVAGGMLVTALARKKKVKLLPVDSEHSAIFQCLNASGARAERIILTASGGPFFGMSREELEKVTVEDALRHPNWSMGKKITVDCATMMNKGLEVIEANWLFGTSPDRIDVAIHRKSIVHSMVQFVDGSVLAQLGAPDMRLAIQYALTWPKRYECVSEKLDIFSMGALEFVRPDMEAFPCLDYAYKALKAGNGAPVALNAANEVAVESFLNREISFATISKIIEQCLIVAPPINEMDYTAIMQLDMFTRRMARRFIKMEVKG